MSEGMSEAEQWWFGSTIGPRLKRATVLHETRTRVTVVDPYGNSSTAWSEPKVCRSRGNEYQWIDRDRASVVEKLTAACAREVAEAEAELKRKRAALMQVRSIAAATGAQQ